MIAGKTRSNTAAAILSNGKDLEDALLAAQNAEGSALAENEKYLDSIQGKLDQFNNAVQTMWSNTLNDEWIKGIVEIGTFLVESIDNLGVIKTLLTVIGAGIIQKYFKGDLFGGLFGDKSSIESVKKGITDLEEAYARAQAKFNSSKSTEDRKAMEDAKANLDAFKETNKPILDAEEHKTALTEQLEKLKAEREQLRGDLQTAQDNLVDITTNGVQEDVREFVEIDTSNIDNQIAGVQEKLDAAKQQLVDAESATWDDYKALGSMTPAKDRDNRVNDKKKEIKELEVELDNLQTKKDEFMSTKIDEVVTDSAKTQVTDLTNKFDEIDKAIQRSEAELKNVEVQANATGNAGLTAGQKFKTGFNRATASIKKFGKEMLKSMAWSMAIAAVFEALGTVGTWISDAFKAADTSAEALQDKFEELDSELSAVESELRSLQSELKDTDERIEELMSQGSLTFVEQEELNKLKSVSAELKAQIGFQETLKKSKQQGVNGASIDATNAYLDTSFMSEKSKSERQEKGKEKGENIGQVVGTALGTLGFFGGPLLGAALMAVGSTVGSTIGGWIGEGIVGAVYDSEQSVSEAMDNMLVERNNLLQKQKDALASGDTEAYNEATEALRTYDAQMAKHISQIQQNYNAMDWATASPEDRKEMMEYADWLDKYNISMGTDGAKSNAIARIFGDEAQGNIAKARDEINKLKENLAKAKNSGEGVDEALAALEGFELNLSEDEVERLRSMGIYLYEVEDYFKKVVDTETEFIDGDLEDVAKDINKITDGLGSLKSAFEEVIEEGVLTAKTVMALKEELQLAKYSDVEGVTDAWREYLDVMMSGAATTEEMTSATQNLAQSIMEAALASENGLTPDNKGEYIAQLRSLGVTNADEYVNDLLQKNMSSELESMVSDAYTDALKDALEDATDGRIPMQVFDDVFNNLSPEKLTELANEYNVVGEIASDTIDDIAESYGVEKEVIQQIIDKLNEKKKIENNIAAAKQAKNDYNDWLNGDGNKKGVLALQEDIAAIEKELNGFDPNQWLYGEKSSEGIVIDSWYYNQEGKRITEQQFADLKVKYDQLVRLKEQYDTIWSQGVANGYIVDGKIIDPNFQAEIDKLQGELNSLTTEIDEELTVDIDLKLDLQNQDELVDDIQSTFDSLVNAQKEYAENGHISVDTMQSLLKLEPKYLDLLVDENGNLNLTKENLHAVARARITDLGLKQQNAIVDQALALATNGSMQALNEWIIVNETADESMKDSISTTKQLILTALKAREATGELAPGYADNFMGILENQLSAVQRVTDLALSDLDNTLSTSGNTATAEVEDAFQKLMDYWDNRISANQAKYDQIQNDIDYLEAQGKIADANYYKDQLALLTEGEESKEAFLEAKLQGAADRLRELEAAGKEGSDEWWEAAKIYNDTLSELDDVRDTVLDLQDAIGEIEWSKFEELNNRIDDVNSKLETMRDLIAPDGEEDWFDDEGNWTEKGVAVLGSYVQSLEYYKNGLNEATEALETFQSKEYNEDNADWFADNYGVHSEQEYYDYLQKLTDEQYNYASSVSDTEQDIAGMWESQVDAVEEYFGTLIESYQDYIENVKEALDAERDLYDFKKNVQKQSKDIAALERRIASLSGSTNASDIAERRKLEAELYDSRESLNDTYYDHSKQSQQEALEAESVAYEETMNRFVENLRTNLDAALENMDTFIQGVTSAVTVNAPTILGVYNSLGVALDSAIVDPWQSAIDAMGEDGYSGEEGLGLMNSWVADGGVFSTFSTKATNYLISVWDDDNVDPGNAFATAVSNKVSGIVTNIQKNVETAKGYLQDLYDVQDSSVYTGGGGGGGGYVPQGSPQPAYSKDVENLQKILNKFFGTNITANGIFDDATREAVKKMQKKIGVLNNGVYNKQTYEALMAYLNKQPVGSWFRQVGFGIPGPMPQYAKGTTGTTRDGFALTDEPQFGDELVLVPGKDGNLSFMRKGTGVVPADMTQKLFELAQIPTSDLMNKNLTAIVPNITKNDFKNEFNFESLVHVDTVDSDTLPKLEKMVDKKIDDFSRALNYSLKKFAR